MAAIESIKGANFELGVIISNNGRRRRTATRTITDEFPGSEQWRTATRRRTASRRRTATRQSTEEHERRGSRPATAGGGIHVQDAEDLSRWSRKRIIRKKAAKFIVENEEFKYKMKKKGKVYISIYYIYYRRLNDRLINVAQEMLKQTAPSPVGLQDVTLGNTLAYNIQTSEFVQILHDGHQHWVTISTIGAKRNEIFIYNSLGTSVSSSVKN